MKILPLILIMLGIFSADIAIAAEPIPMPRPLDLTGLHAYAEKTVTAGKTIHFRTSSTVPYELAICRLGLEVDDPTGDEVLKTFFEPTPCQQPIHPGSFVHVDKGLPEEDAIEALSLECWVRPWKLNGWQTLISQHNYPVACGYALGIDTEGRVQFYLGDGGAYQPGWALAGPALSHRQWHHVVGIWDGQTMSLWVNGKRVAAQAFKGPAKAGAAPLRLGACADNGPVVNLLDGDLAMPVIYDKALSADEIKARLRQQGLEPATGDGVLACWPLAEEKGDRVADCSPHRRHGRIFNSATWMIGGPSFDGGKVPRYGDYDPANDPKRGHGLRFASDDLYDCRWQVTADYRIPETARPGLYVGRFRYEMDGQARIYHTTFVVKKPKARPQAPILVLAATGTWGAYSATSFPVNPPGLHHNWPCGGLENCPGNPPAYCMYRDHHAGQPAYKIGLRKPWPNAGPYVLYSAESVGYSHIMRAERFFHVWLEQAGYDYDIIGDLDLHRDPKQLDGYQVVVINGHSEYWSAKAYDAIDRFLCAGGNVMVLSGNSIYWRVSYNDEGTIMECRKLAGTPGGRPGSTVGEIWHSQDGRRGSLTRECGYPAWKLVGLATLGFWGGASNTVYEVQQPDHFLFQHPEPVRLAKGEAFGGAPDGGLPRAVGHEPDVRLALLRQLTKEIPAGAKLPEEPPGIVTLAEGNQPDAAAFDYFSRPVRLVDGVACHMIYWQRPRGGRVFHAGSLGAGWGLSADPKFQTLIRNVLHHFGVAPEVPRPGVATAGSEEGGQLTLPARGICAHRGASDTHPENTLTAFREALRLGAHMIEFDVALTKDGHLVLMHDTTVDRTTNGKGPVSELTLAELQKLDAGSWKADKFANERIPTLDEVFRMLPDNIWLNVHLKGDAELAEKVTRRIFANNRLEQAFLACGAEAARAAKRIDSRIKICNMDRQDNSVRYVNDTIKMKADFIQLLGEDSVDSARIKRLRDRDIRINYCCANETNKVQRLFEAGVEFPLVDSVSAMLRVSDQNGIKRLSPLYRSRLQHHGLATPYSTLVEQRKLEKGAASQGLALASKHYFTSTAHSIFRYDTNWNLVEEKPIRIEGVNHIGAIDHHDGFLWAGLLCGPENGKHDPKLDRSIIAKIRASDLVVVKTWDITRDVTWIDPVCFDSPHLWVGNLSDLGIHRYRFDGDTMVHDGVFRYPKAMHFSQGIRVVGRKLYTIHTFGEMDGLFEFDIPDKLTDEIQHPTRVWQIAETEIHLEGFDFVPGQPNQIWQAQGRQVDRYELW